jgi:hypothetical protein
MMRAALLSFTLATLLGGCSSGPAAPTVETGTMVVRPAEHWTYGTTPRYALAEQFQYAGNSAAPARAGTAGRHPAAGRQRLAQRSLDEADVWVAIGVAGSQDMSDGEIFSRLGMTPGLNAAANARKGTLAVVLLDGHSQKAVWSSAIQLASDVPVAEEARGA